MRPAELGWRCAIISDRNVAPRYGKVALQALKRAGFEAVLIRVPAGETAKSLQNVRACYDQLAAHRLERKSFIVALGGGVVGDLAGFVAATYLRGMRLCKCRRPCWPSGQLGGGQGRRQFESRQEPRRRVLSAAAGVVRPGHAGDAAGARVSRRPGRGDQIRHHL